MAPNLAKPKRGKTAHIRRYFRDLPEHFPTSDVKIGGTVCKLCHIYHFRTLSCRKSVKTQDVWVFFKEELFFWNVLNTMRPEGAKSVEKSRKYYRKTEKKSFLRKIWLCSRGCKASFYLITTWQALVSWRGMTRLYFLPLVSPWLHFIVGMNDTNPKG